MNLPSWVSLFRIFLAALCSVAILQGYPLSALIGIILAALSDILDGFLARKLKLESEKGRQLDRLCDQVLELFLVLSFFIIEQVPLWFFIVVFSRCLLQIGTSPFLFKTLAGVYEEESGRRKGERRDKLGSAMTLVVFFFVSLALVFKEEAQPLSQGLQEIALPYVLFPLSGILEVINLYLQSWRLGRFFKN